MSVLQPKTKRRIKVKSFNENITCVICSGYLIRPVAVTECLHTFCRSCIVKYLENASEYTCPACNVVIHETNPWELLREDKSLEDIIFKLVPRLKRNERQRRVQFFSSRGLTDPEEMDIDLDFCSEPEEERDENEPPKKQEDQDESKTAEKSNKDKPKSIKQLGSSQIGFRLSCFSHSPIKDTDNKYSKYCQELEKRYIRCSSHLTVAHLKKYLQLKLDLPESCEVDILCNGEIMGKHHTLEFIYMTRWRYKDTLLDLEYRPKIELADV